MPRPLNDSHLERLKSPFDRTVADLGHSASRNNGHSQHVMNRTAAELLSASISNPHDALHLLSEAAGRSEDLNRQALATQTPVQQSPSILGSTPTMPRTSGRETSSAQDGKQRPNLNGSNPLLSPHLVDPAMIRSGLPRTVTAEEVEYKKAAKEWSRLRFVRAGWFTAAEAMEYVE